MDLNGLNWRKSSYNASGGARIEVAVTWRKSSYSTSNSNCVEVAMMWHKSSYSTSNGGACVEVGMTPSDSAGNGGACVEVGMTGRKSSHSTSNGGACLEVARPSVTVVAVRDSKDPGGPVLSFSPAAWQAFTGQIKAGGPGLG